MEFKKDVNITLMKTIHIRVPAGSVVMDDLHCIFECENKFEKSISINGYQVSNDEELKKALKYFKIGK